jgi:hypothetical protein
MIIWSGAGILVPVIFAADLAIFAFVNTHVHLEGSLGWLPFCAILFLSAIGLWYLSKALDKGSSRELFDPKTGEKVILKKRHTFFFIPMKAWAVIFVVLDVLWFILVLVKR